MSQATQPISASIFHAGGTCPFCQENIAAGQLIVTCPQCSSAHHETCWQHKGGCSSYHCDKSTRGNAGNQQADILIRADELKNVYVPPPPVKRSGQEIAAAYLPKPPRRISRMALASAALTAFSVAGLLGVLLGSVTILTVGVSLAILAVVFGVLGLLFINNAENQLSGMPLAGWSVVGATILTVLFFGLISMQVGMHSAQQNVNLKLSESLPTAQDLAEMKPAVANAMRANVVINTRSGILESRYGSGVVVKVTDHKAYILTNKHVIGDKKSGFDVLFYSGERSSATVEWSAPGDTDIALITCNVLSLEKYMPIDVETGHIASGEKVFAVGNPMGLAWSYSEGTISSLRVSGEGAQAVEMYQTQTPINSGNSGGGLYSLSGTLVGINTLTHDKATSEGLSFSLTTAGILALFKPEERARYFFVKAKPAGEIPN